MEATKRRSDGATKGKCRLEISDSRSDISDCGCRRLFIRPLVALVVSLAAGCAQPAGEIFPPLAKPLVWPAAPEQPRIRYVGQLSTNEDLKPAKPFGEALAEAIMGRKPVLSMLTPFACCTDGGDRLFVADSNAQLVHVFNLKTREYARWKPEGKQPVFSQPVGIAWSPDERLLVADSMGGALFTFDSSGRYTGQLGMGKLQRPCGVAVHPVTGRIYIADATAHQIVVLSSTGAELARLGRRGTALGEFNYPTSVAMDSQGRLYVCDSLNFRVQQIGTDMKTVRQIGRKGDMPGYFAQPKGVALDSADHLYVLDAQFESVQIFDPEGRLLLDFGEEGGGPGQFWLPTSMFIDHKDRIWIADSYNQRIQVFDFLPEKP
jgi:DNA-binding beta-propeller fold protein YncE